MTILSQLKRTPEWDDVVKMNSRNRDPEKMRSRIIDSALTEFSEMGFGGATLRGIATRVGITHGSIQRYFRTKNELWLIAIAPYSRLKK